MTVRKDGGILKDFRTLFSIGTPRDLTDGQLLERFATSHGESAELAFSTLVERHGSMVLRVCRGILADPNDAQDAFQATFLVLVKRARSLWVRDSIGPWLYQVAYRTAMCVRRTAARRRRLERRVAIPADAGRPDVSDDELTRMLHEEIHRLPERYRAPIVLCDLEGQTHELAARNLGWPVGTVKSRLTRGRERLRGRLLRRGVAPNAGLLAAALRPDNLTPFLSPSLLDGTTRAAIQFAGFRTVVVGSAATLAQEVLRSMILTGSLKITAVMLAAGATTVSGLSLATPTTAPGRGAEEPSGILLTQAAPKSIGPRPAVAPPVATPVARQDGKTYTIRPGKFSLAVVNRGKLESSRSDSVVSRVEGQTRIINLVPEGTRVKKGDLVCELDSAELRDRLTNQKIATQEKQAAYENATQARVVAEIAVTEYLEGSFQIKRMELVRDAFLAQSALRRSEVRLQQLRSAHKRAKEILGKLPEAEVRPADIVAGLDIEDRLGIAEVSIMADKLALETAEAKKNNLEKYTKPRTTKELTSEVEKARATELSKQATFDLQKAIEEKLKRQIMDCKLYAPSDGVVVYSPPAPGSMGGGFKIEEGAPIRERQVVCSIINFDTPMLVKARIPELQIGRVQSGQKVRIKADAFSNELLMGEVLESSPLADAATNQSDRTYTTRIKIDKTPLALKPGMSAEVEILTGELDEVLSIPRRALANTGFSNAEQGQVALKKPDGTIEWRMISLGRSNVDRVEIKEGLQEGETVLIDPPHGGLQ